MAVFDDELTYFRVGLPDETMAQLMQLSEESHWPPAQMLSALVTDTLRQIFDESHVSPGYSPEKPLH